MTGGKPEPIEVTVTFLEMTAPPVAHAPLPTGQHIVLLKVQDIPLHYYRYLIDRVGRKWHWVNALRLNDEELTARLQEPGRDIRVLYLDGAPAGFFDLTPYLPERVDLTFFGLMAHAMGRGLARWFLGAAVEAAWSANPAVVTVQTCTLDHPAALPLYQKIGFNPIAQKKELVQPLDMSERMAVVMR